jgi:hypothetical protein
VSINLYDLYGENITAKMSPNMIKIVYFLNFESSMRNGIILWGGDRVKDTVFKLQNRVLRIIYGLSSRKSCRQIFKDYKFLTLPSLYVLEVICFTKKYKVFMERMWTFVVVTCERSWIFMCYIVILLSKRGVWGIWEPGFTIQSRYK